MKRFFIFAAMLLTLTVYAGTSDEDPPLITPAVEQIILVPQDMYDIDRTIASCRYSVSEDWISIFCFGTGSETNLYLVDDNGRILQCTCIDPANTPVITFDKPVTDGIYYIVLDSGRYYGEGRILI